ncbi:MAG: hypothetical protein ABIM02_05645 [candidate division WOR-3 bacterium]
MIKEHSRELFGEEIEFFDIKAKIKSEIGVGSIPDGYLIKFGDEASWYIVEIELSKHDLEEHIQKQISRFIRGIKNFESRRKIIDKIYEEIKNNPELYKRIKEKITPKDILQYLLELFSREPGLVVVIEKKTPELKEICDVLRIETIALECRTFVKEGGDPREHLHLLEPFSQVILPIYPVEVEKRDKIQATLAGRKVVISREDILKASKDPRIQYFGFRDWCVEIEGKQYPVKGLISLATGIPTNEFGSAQVRPLLKKLGFEVKKINE